MESTLVLRNLEALEYESGKKLGAEAQQRVWGTA